MDIGKKIKELRRWAGLTQEELANAIGTKKQTICKYEAGIITNIPASKIKALADVLNTTPEHLMGWDKKEGLSLNLFAGYKHNDLTQDIVSSIIDSKIDEGYSLYYKLDAEDKAEIRGEMKQMLKADKYN